jgi:hypothetical protein
MKSYRYNKSIPKTIYICNKTLDKSEQSTNLWKTLNPDYNIQVYDDSMCKDFLLNIYGKLYLDIFNYLIDGPIKADFWRICILYKYGGVYSDIDIVPLVPISSFLDPSIQLLTCSSYYPKDMYNPHLIISTANNIILKRCIDVYINKFNNKMAYSYWDWSIVKVFNDVVLLNNYYKDEGIYVLKNSNMKVQIIKEQSNENKYDFYNVYNKVIILKNRSKLWNYKIHSFILDDGLPF